MTVANGLSNVEARGYVPAEAGIELVIGCAGDVHVRSPRSISRADGNTNDRVRQGRAPSQLANVSGAADTAARLPASNFNPKEQAHDQTLRWHEPGAQSRCSPWQSGALYAQTKDALAQIDATLAEAGTSKSRILRTTVYITDMSKKPEMDRAWDEWVDKANAPQRACIGVALADKDLVEILVTAAV